MSNYTDFMATIRDWSARPDHSDMLVDGFMRSAESNLNRVLRVKEMMEIRDAVVTESRVALPVGWRELDYVRVNNGRPLEFMNREDFFKEERTLRGKYTITGNNIQFGDPIDATDGNAIEISVYMSVPHLSASLTTTWLFEHFHDIYLQSVLVVAFGFGLENDRALATSNMVQQMIVTANEEHTHSRVSGSTLRLKQNRGRIG